MDEYSKWWFLTDTFNFIPDEWKYDGTYTDATWPASAVLLTEDEVLTYRGTVPPAGMFLGCVDGRPAWVNPPPISEEEIEAAQRRLLLQKNQLAAAQKTALTNRIGTINDAIEFEEVTPEELEELPIRQAQLVLWKKYAIALGRVTAQAGWFHTVEWPAEPPEGMDLSVSAVSDRSSATQ